MSFNPFYHWRTYRQQAEEIRQQKQFNNLLLDRNAELCQDLAKAQKQLDQANAKITKLQEELDEIQSEFLILVNAKTISRKEARELRHAKTPSPQVKVK